MRTRPLLCLVTDRRRLAGALGRPLAEWRTLLLAQLEGAMAGGIDLVQVREPDLEAGELAGLVRDALRLAERSSTRVIVNDRLDVAIAAGAHGVHLRERSFAAATLRQRSPALLIGRSVHSRDAAARAVGVDYLIAGTIFPTTSKAVESPVIGLEGLEAIVRAAPATIVLAIGGITQDRLGLVARAGAHGIAAIGAFIPDAEADEVAKSVEKSVRTLRFRFDTDSAVP